MVSYFYRREIESRKDDIVEIMKHERTVQDLRDKKVDVCIV